MRAVDDVDDASGPFDLVLESVGGTSLPRALARVRTGGSLIWFGQASRRPVELDFFACFEQTGATIRHFHYEDSAIPVSRDLETLVRLVDRGRLHPELGLVANWTQTATALEQLRDRSLRGNAVLWFVCPQNPNSKGPNMSQPTDVKTVIRRYVSALEAGDERTVRDLFGDKATWTLAAGELPISGTWEGRDAILDDFLATALSYYEPRSVNIDITAMIAEGDKVVLQWTSRAKTRTGRRYENGCIGVFTVRDGRIQDVREYMDTLYAHDQAFAAVGA